MQNLLYLSFTELKEYAPEETLGWSCELTSGAIFGGGVFQILVVEVV